MKIDIQNNQVALKEIFEPITLVTSEFNVLTVCMRDDTFEVKISDGGWLRADLEKCIFKPLAPLPPLDDFDKAFLDKVKLPFGGQESGVDDLLQSMKGMGSQRSVGFHCLLRRAKRLEEEAVISKNQRSEMLKMFKEFSEIITANLGLGIFRSPMRDEIDGFVSMLRD
jgi:hypothetical protein